MIVVEADRRGGGTPWRMICRSDGRADVLAEVRQPGGWARALERLRDAVGTLDIRPGADSQYRWVLTDPRGGVVAASPAVYRDCDSCRKGFAAARRAARDVMGEPADRPRAR